MMLDGYRNALINNRLLKERSKKNSDREGKCKKNKK